MKRTKLGLAVASGVMAGALAWAAGNAQSQDSYVKIDADSLVRSPQNSWARAILFTDVLVSAPDGRTQRLDRKIYVEMKLKTAGKVWVPEELAPKFKRLKAGDIYSFAGTVDQISRRYYVIVDACYTIQTADDLSEQWTDILNPSVEVAGDEPSDVSETAMQALLLEAQNSLIQLAQEHNTSVAQMIEAQTDGGQRIAESIVANALQGELRSQNKTAEELMIGAVVALLQKQAVLDESARIAAENAAISPAIPEPASAAPDALPVVVAAVGEEIQTTPLEMPAVESLPPESEIHAPEAMTEVPPVIAADSAVPEEELPTEESRAQAITVPETTDASIQSDPSDEKQTAKPRTSKSKKKQKKAKAEEMPADPAMSERVEASESPVAEISEESAMPPAGGGLAALLPPADEVAAQEASSESVVMPPGLTLEEEIEAARAAELIAPEGAGPDDLPIAPPPSSMLVVPLSGPQLEMVPLVSAEPTKAELAQMKKQEAQALRERKIAEKKAVAEAARQRKIEAKRAKKEAKQRIIAEKKAAKEARLAEIARQKAEEQRAREEAAARKAAEKKALQEAAQAQAEAKAAMAEEAKRLALEEQLALEAVRQAEERRTQAESVRLLREETEKRLAEMAARKEVAEAQLRAMEEQKQAALKRIQEEVEAKAAAQAAEQAAQIAAEKSRQEESIRIAQEVAEQETLAAEEAAARIEKEVAARKAAEKKLNQLEQEIRELEAAARQANAELKRGLEPEAIEVIPTALPPAEVTSADGSETEKPSKAERRKQQAAERKAAELARRDAEAAEKAAAKARMKEESQKAIDSGDLPEWMQPMRY